MEPALQVVATPLSAIPEHVASVRRSFEARKTRPIAWRKQQLLAIQRLVNENRREITAALPELEVLSADILNNLSDAKYHLKNVDLWAARRSVSTPGFLLPGSSYVQPEPLGVVLIISPWNYPIHLIIKPLLAAIAAGNAVVIKPSEVSAHCAVLIQDLVGRYLDTDAIRVVQGGVDETTALLRERFDHILYTGNGAVGRVILQAAALHLTPVTLELGGKSPVYVDKDANLDLAAHRILWGKFCNCGQMCVAPDYALVHRDVLPAFIEKCKAALVEYFGVDPRKSESLGRIINRRHFDRIAALLVNNGGGTLVAGGEGLCDAEDLFVPPTLILEPDRSSLLMTEEIFGPILPIIGVSGVEEAVNFVASRPKPLALYVFSSSRLAIDAIIGGTSSGGVTINDTVVHTVSHELKFGGVGASGMGAYHGQFGFKTFSHLKPVFHQSTLFDLVSVRYAPYSPEKMARVAFLLQHAPELPHVEWKDIALVGAIAALAAAAWRIYSK